MMHTVELFWNSFLVLSGMFHIDIVCGKEKNPITLFNDDAKNRIVILNSDSNYWAQQVYQLAHELTHFFIGGSVEEHNNWFYESLAELSSNFFLQKMAELALNSTDATLKQYAHSFQAYQNTTALSVSENVSDLVGWIRGKEEYLLQNKIDRNCNAVVAKQFLKYFLHEDDIWNILLFAPHQNIPLKELFEAWIAKIPNEDKHLCRHIQYFQYRFGV